MKTKIARCLLFTAGLFLSGCWSLEDIPPETDPGTGTEPGPSLVGTPTGPATTAVVGPAGGTLASADGMYELVVPAGALAAEVELKLTPISNEAPLGIRGALRFEPDGTEFAIPATLVFHYGELEGTSPELLLLATQTPDGHWEPAAPLDVDTEAQTATADIAHFSDWSFATCARLEVDSYVLDPYTVANLSVVSQCDSPETHTGFLGGAAATTQPVDWDNTDRSGNPGPGTLTESGPTATLEAPASPPVDPLAFVSATVSHAGVVRTFRDTVVVGSLLSFTVDGHSVIVTKEAPLVMSQGGKSGLLGANTTGSLTLGWVGEGVGGFRSDPANESGAGATVGPDMTNYYDVYTTPCGNDIRYTITTVSVSHASRERQFIRGSFDGTLAIGAGDLECNTGGVSPLDIRLVPLQGMFVVRWLPY
jgi:hypothetical protein